MNARNWAIIATNNPQLGSLLLKEEEKERRRKTIERLSSMIDLNEPNFKALRAMLQADLINPEQYFSMALALKQYQNTVYQFIYKMNKDIFAMKSEMFRNELEKMQADAYVKTQEAVRRGQEIDAKVKRLNAGRQAVELYLKPYEEALNTQYDNLLKQVATEVSLSKRDLFQSFEEASKGEKLKVLQDAITKAGIAKEYYPKLNALAHMESLIQRAKVKAYEMMDRAVQQKGLDAVYDAPVITAKAFTQALHNQHAINYHINLNFQDAQTQQALDKTEREVRNTAVAIFGPSLGKAIITAMEADKKVFGDKVVAPTPIVPTTKHELDEDKEDKLRFGLKEAVGMTGAAVATHYAYKWFKNKRFDKGVTEFDKQVIKEAQKAAGVPKEMVKSEAKEVVKQGAKKAEKKVVKGAVGKVLKGGKTAGVLGAIATLAMPEELNAGETEKLKKALNKGGSNELQSGGY